ncbi:MAG: nuclear transport factor 2 family protein [Actinomycetota bacterium]|nr:nuclear transport factor 2 family protein [Actinomycetota bacterium]
MSSANSEAVRQLHDPESGRLRRDPLFDLLDEEVEWSALGPIDLFPWAGTHHGHEGVRRWFELLNAAMAYERFDLLELYSDGETVVEVIAAAGKACVTEAPFASEVVRVWTFRKGKAIRVRSYYDTHGYAAALLGNNFT